jgi:hypothetical protein
MQNIVVSLVVAACFVLPAVSASAVTEGSGLTTKVGRPGTSWSQTLNLNAGELVNVLITYTNQSEFVQKYVTIRDTLPAGATFKSGSAYLFNAAAPQGAQQADTLTTSGIHTGAIKPGQNVFVQFQMTMPGMNQIDCGSRQVVNRADAVSASGNKTYTAQNTLSVSRSCAVTTQPVPPTTTTSTPAAPVVTTATATATTGTTQRTAPVQTVATTPNADSKSLVNTGPGSILLIALVAALVGTLGSRIVLYRLFGS